MGAIGSSGVHKRGGLLASEGMLVSRGQIYGGSGVHRRGIWSPSEGKAGVHVGKWWRRSQKRIWPAPWLCSSRRTAHSVHSVLRHLPHTRSPPVTHSHRSPLAHKPPVTYSHSGPLAHTTRHPSHTLHCRLQCALPNIVRAHVPIGSSRVPIGSAHVPMGSSRCSIRIITCSNWIIACSS